MFVMWACDGHSAAANIEDDPNSGKSRVIDPVTGDTIYVEDTVVVYKDTTLRWVGSSALLITEISPLNTDWRDLDGDDGAWVEIFNAGDRSANLKGYSLVESLKDPKKWVFGDELIAAKSFRTVFLDKKDIRDVSKIADGQDESGNKLRSRTHTNWKLDKSGGTLYLIDPSNGIRDSVQYPDINTAGVSWGIVDGGAWKYFGKSTPEAKNTESIAYDGFAENPDFGDVKAGFYGEAVTVNPPSVGDGATVRCTQNGSAPTDASPEFNEPMKISKNMVLRCAAYKKGNLPSKVVTKTFFIGEKVQMPVVAISVDSAFFRNNYLKGLNCSDPKSCPSGLMADVEYPVHVEYFENGSFSNAPAWEIEAGISLMGNWSRVYDKKTVAIVMREDYEDGWLHYPLFETRKGVNDKYKAFNLRNNGNRFVSDYIEDAAGGAILEGSGVDYQRSRQVVVFYNGKYMGIHDMRERYNKNYVETNYGIDASTVNFIKHLGREITASNGTTDNYISMLKYVASNNMSVEANYATAKTMLDVGNFADYMATEIYSHNGDWPNNNVRAWRSPDQPWKFMIYDLDHGYGWKWGANNGEFNDKTNMFSWIKQGGTSSASCHSNNDPMCFHNLYVNLIESPSFKRLFINRSAVMLQNYLNGANFTKAVDAIVATMDGDEIKRDLEKFKQDEKYYPDGFSKTGSTMKNWAYERDAKVRSEYASEFGLSSDIQVTIASSGKGKVLMEGMNLPGSTATSTNYTGTFFGGVQMELTAVPASGAMFTGWSDKNTDNPRIVTPTNGASYTAIFE
ncbi:MAG: CotH kinase family protein [Fibrobacter sp.]|nr:CotH kinase family protein [Fibrobacter sp.]